MEKCIAENPAWISHSRQRNTARELKYGINLNFVLHGEIFGSLMITLISRSDGMNTTNQNSAATNLAEYMQGMGLARR